VDDIEADRKLFKEFDDDECFFNSPGTFIAPNPCRVCGATGLLWVLTDKGFRLSPDGEHLHICAPVASPEEFEDLNDCEK
jgi:hypothetical protein